LEDIGIDRRISKWIFEKQATNVVIGLNWLRIGANILFKTPIWN
jgi:hypothetical protein